MPDPGKIPSNVCVWCAPASRAPYQPGVVADQSLSDCAKAAGAARSVANAAPLKSINFICIPFSPSASTFRSEHGARWHKDRSNLLSGACILKTFHQPCLQARLWLKRHQFGHWAAKMNSPSPIYCLSEVALNPDSPFPADREEELVTQMRLAQSGSRSARSRNRR